jgi:hypothetical protein
MNTTRTNKSQKLLEQPWIQHAGKTGNRLWKTLTIKKSPAVVPREWNPDELQSSEAVVEKGGDQKTSSGRLPRQLHSSEFGS